MKLLYSFVLLIVLIDFNSQEQKPPNQTDNQTHLMEDDLNISEWKKFKNFKAQLDDSKSTENAKELSLKSYTRDSLKILSVKLMAIKVLDEEKLLERDITENTVYYKVLLNQLKESNIAPSDYLFFENRLNHIVNQNLEKKVQRSNLLIFGLALLVLILGFYIFRKWNKVNKEIPQLSKQEKTVQNLILQGKSNKEIANELFISISTVKTHITNLYSKLKVANREELFENSTSTST